jgi:hypothetical protein
MIRAIGVGLMLIAGAVFMRPSFCVARARIEEMHPLSGKSEGVTTWNKP